ncbi:hypothetical protein D3C85_1918330 [compost metagenome]
MSAPARMQVTELFFMPSRKKAFRLASLSRLDASKTLLSRKPASASSPARVRQLRAFQARQTSGP